MRGLWEDGLGSLMPGGLGVLDWRREGGELICRATAECCLTAGGPGVGEGGLVIECISFDGLGAVGGGTGFGETGGGIFFPSPAEMKRENSKAG